MTQRQTLTRRVANNVKALRDARGWSQDLLARRLQLAGSDINRAVIANIEAGRRQELTLEDLAALSLAFNVSPLYLVSAGDVARIELTQGAGRERAGRFEHSGVGCHDHQVEAWFTGERAVLAPALLTLDSVTEVDASAEFRRHAPPGQMTERAAETEPAVQTARLIARTAADIAVEVNAAIVNEGDWHLDPTIVSEWLGRLRSFRVRLERQCEDLAERAEDLMPKTTTKKTRKS